MIKIPQLLIKIEELLTKCSLLNNPVVMPELIQLKNILEKYPKIDKKHIQLARNFRTLCDINLFDFKSNYLETAKIIAEKLEERDTESLLKLINQFKEEEQSVIDSYKLNPEIINLIDSLKNMNQIKLQRSTLFEDIADQLSEDINNKELNFQVLISDLKDVVCESLKIIESEQEII